MKILVIDDDELVRMTCRNALKKQGYTVLEAESGKDGIASFHNNKPDLVITDMLMPDKEGLETITDIRRTDPKARVLAMSGGGNTGNMTFLELARKVGADQIIQKPLRPELFIRTVNNLLSQ